ncbi:MAG: periplasmic divalent cation tolerance protein [Thermoplasmata archaeon]|nr:periplasmic divalent cation tolerance protein [Thermoplasmata archaeon]
MHVTFPDLASAKSVCRALVEERLAACANLVPCESLYVWEGALADEREVVAILKTTAGRLDALTRRAVELHPDEVPCVVAVPIVAGFPSYVAWVQESTRP